MKLIISLFLSAALFLGLGLLLAEDEKQEGEIATFAGGCFWCIEAPFEKVEGVISAVSGYSGGEIKDPSYKQVSSGRTKHLEVVQITFDPNVVSYETLVEIFWRQFDPTDAGGSFYDRGMQYTSAIFYHNEAQKKIAEASKARLEESGVFDKKIVTPIRPAAPFYPAEDYHQDYYKKNPSHYQRYRSGSGRDAFIRKIWGDDWKKSIEMSGSTREDLKARLTPMQYKVTQEDGTEPPFRNEYWDNKAEGIYVDIVSGEALFSSTHKYNSGTGWPSFWQPLEAENIVEKIDTKLWVPRTEVRSKGGDSHLGHVFSDGPQPTGLRYCINSAALRFIPKEKLAEEGYEQYLALFENKSE